MQTPRTDAQPTDVLEPAPPSPAGAAPSRAASGDKAPRASRVPSIIVGVIVAAIAGLSIWYLVRAAAAAGPGRSRCDAARHRRARRRPRRRHPGDARRERRGRRGAGADRQSRKRSPSTSRRWRARSSPTPSLPTSMPARAPEVIAARKAALERAQASVVLAQKTYDRISQLAEHGNAPQARLDQVTDSLHESRARGRSGEIRLRAGGQRLHRRRARDRRGERTKGGSPTSRPCSRSSIRW